VAGKKRAAADLLEALGVELSDESHRDTPRRIARMYAEMLGGNRV
jgi:GTP cyclohydrolase I